MIVYHGTTHRRAQRIAVEGFLLRKPSRRAWFAESRAYAEGRAKTQARRAHDRPVVLACEIDLARMRGRLGAKRVFHRNRVIAIDAPVPATVLRSHPGLDVPGSPAELAAWVNDVLGLKPYKGVSPRDPGIDRLARWVARRCAHQGRVKPRELLYWAAQWLPEHFENVEIDPDTLGAYRKMGEIEMRVEPPAPPADPREDEALELLEDAGARRRIRGLQLLAKIQDADLFDWCAMFLADESAEVRLAALRALRQCEPDDAEIILPFAESRNQRIRAAAIAALVRHAGADGPRWLERGLRDPSPCVRLEAAGMLRGLDPAENREVFELALYDPNPNVARRARKLVGGKGFRKLKARPRVR